MSNADNVVPTANDVMLAVNSVNINFDRILGKRNPMIYGLFIEHFHRQIYGGIFSPGSPLADGHGMRMDVAEALKRIAAPIMRWPGGCFVSSYHWKDGVGAERRPLFDKAWRVEEPNIFGTDEFVRFCRLVGCEPYICTNAGTGTAEEMSDWVEYCNLQNEGANARQRIRNGHGAPYNVRYWSIGNENYGAWEIGAKKADEWALLAAEAAKMMKHVDPTIELSAAALPDAEWNLKLLEHAGDYLDWISIHEYWDGIHQTNALATYEQAMAYTAHLEDSIRKAEGILEATGYAGRIKIAFDEWNLRGWHHPNTLHADKSMYLAPRDKNDDNSSYTMADAVFTACFLNTLLRRHRSVHMANYAPAVNTRGLIYAYDEGIVLRGTYHVFDMFVNLMGEELADCWDASPQAMRVTHKNADAVEVCRLDVVATRKKDGRAAISIINKHAYDEARLDIRIQGLAADRWRLSTLNGTNFDDYNDVGRPDSLCIVKKDIQSLDSGRDSGRGSGRDGCVSLTLPPHSVNVLESL